MFKIIRLSLLMIVLCGIAYPLAMIGLAQTIFPDQANGSLVTNEEGKVIGSELIGQNFKRPEFFQGRVSSIENNGAATGSNNYAPSNEDMLKRTEASIKALKKENSRTETNEMPVDLVTNSGSGLDPHISVEAAEFQIDRVSKASGLRRKELRAIIDKSMEKRDLGLFGEERVNVLLLNMNVQEAMRK
ncbi:potassium-transporting ATPase subunit KdpC [Fictibacillus iocasae]|uniref:Potassium-transporting ATPase KdpC subunit n=1 Tax=Fictibacillus iocasae TaxID=2715437 RepID=A0ABW2NQW4_9BACL